MSLLPARPEGFVVPILVGLAGGFVQRTYVLVRDLHHFPTFPHGRIIHFFLGFVAAVVGTLVVPAVLKPDFTAAVFLGLAGSQFHVIRGEERKTLLNADRANVVPRGPHYVEGIAMAFEARNFAVMGTALIGCASTYFLGLWAGAGITLAAVGISEWLVRGEKLGRLVHVQVRRHAETPGSVSGKEPAPPRVTLRFVPRNLRARALLLNPGQQQAIVHDLASLLGMEIGPEGKPRAPKVVAEEDGTLVIHLWPMIDAEAYVQRVAAAVPALENVMAPLVRSGRV